MAFWPYQTIAQLCIWMVVVKREEKESNPVEGARRSGELFWLYLRVSLPGHRAAGTRLFTIFTSFFLLL